MRLLLKSGADPALVDTDGRIARQLAERLADSVAAAKAADKQGGGGGEPARPPRDDAPDAAPVDQILDLLDLAELVRPFLPSSIPPSLPPSVLLPISFPSRPFRRPTCGNRALFPLPPPTRRRARRSKRALRV